MFDSIIKTPIGKIGLKFSGEKLINLAFLSAATKCRNENLPIAKKVYQELEKYFANPKHIFTVDFELVGTPLQKKIWLALKKIPSGSTVTYKKLAAKLKTGPRVIGNACRANPIPIIIPCHRVVSVNGLGGFCGKNNGIMICLKKNLLIYENRNSRI
ncbi:MAG: methylated-DNA--[protein]-cysteine S-methyltransferase [Gammaproteobacteria bacterium]|nr:methylated-DNA--[protein]-cysteine S-methyltransferase [Gammaproteobacteria bacterium]